MTPTQHHHHIIILAEEPDFAREINPFIPMMRFRNAKTFFMISCNKRFFFRSKKASFGIDGLRHSIFPPLLSKIYRKAIGILFLKYEKESKLYND